MKILDYNNYSLDTVAVLDFKNKYDVVNLPVAPHHFDQLFIGDLL